MVAKELVQLVDVLWLVRFTHLPFKGFDVFLQESVVTVLLFWFNISDLVCKDRMTII